MKSDKTDFGFLRVPLRETARIVSGSHQFAVKTDSESVYSHPVCETEPGCYRHMPAPDSDTLGD